MGLRQQIKLREQELNNVLEKCDMSLKKAPKGRLKVYRKGNHAYYSVRERKNSGHSKYIRRSDNKLAQRIAQRDYDESVKKSVEQELGAITSFEKKAPGRSFESIFENLNPDRKLLITPYHIPDKEYVESWMSKIYKCKSFSENDPEHYTNKNERVRSKSEVIIANRLNDLNIPYKYEYPIRVDGILYHPDFAILKMPERKVIYWEHLGKMHDPDYVLRNMKRLISFEKAGIFLGDNLIITMESENDPLNQGQIDSVINHYFL